MPYSAHYIIYTAFSTLYLRALHPSCSKMMMMMMTTSTINAWMCLLDSDCFIFIFKEKFHTINGKTLGLFKDFKTCSGIKLNKNCFFVVLRGKIWDILGSFKKIMIKYQKERLVGSKQPECWSVWRQNLPVGVSRLSWSLRRSVAGSRPPWAEPTGSAASSPRTAPELWETDRTS